MRIVDAKPDIVVLAGAEGRHAGVAQALRDSGFVLQHLRRKKPWEQAGGARLLCVDGGSVPLLRLARETTARLPSLAVLVLGSPEAEVPSGWVVCADETSVVQRAREHLEVTRPPKKAAGLVGGSEPMRRLLAAIDRVARFATGALVLGESGSGKELIARALHDRGPRRSMPFIAVNCATLGKDLLENELFGHERGAFTGANEQKPGLFEMANGGTLFLDEVGEIDPGTQAKLLRVLERSEFRRVGGVEKLHVDVSVVAATNRDLRAAIASGRFREDLYYRLKVVTLTVPPLRDRREDIPLLVSSILSNFNQRHGMQVGGVSADALSVLSNYEWPGNVRELKNVVESAAMLSDERFLSKKEILEALDLSSSVPAPTTAAATSARSAEATPGELRIKLPAKLADVERLLIESTLQRTPNKSVAAQSLGLGLRTLYTKLNQWSNEIDDSPL